MSFSFLKEKKFNTKLFFVYATCSIWTNKTWQEKGQHTVMRIIADTKTMHTAHASMETMHMDQLNVYLCPQMNECLIHSKCEDYCVILGQKCF